MMKLSRTYDKAICYHASINHFPKPKRIWLYCRGSVAYFVLSSGIHDLRLGRSRAADIHDKLKSFTRQFKAQFLFEAVSPMSMNADRFNTINAERDKLNRYLFQLSLRQENFKLFDNLSFGLAHLARDGLHLNNPGKAIVSSNWVECILIRLGFYRGSLPIRREFRRIAYEYNDMSRSR